MSDVFKELYGVDVGERTEKNQGLTYLSWAWAWAEVKKKYPDAKYEIKKFENNLPYVFDEKTGYMVFTEVTIEDQTHEMWLPVMNHQNLAMLDKPYQKKFKNSSATVEAATMFDINKTIMRCLTKNLAMFGLGLYIYAGEDLPEAPPIEKITIKEAGEINKKIDELAKLLDEENGKVKLGRWAVGKFASNGNKISDIDKPNYQHVMKALDEMIKNNQPKEEPAEEQESLFEGNTTKVKAQGSD